MPIKNLRITATPAQAGRLDALVAKALAWPRARARGLVAHGGVVVNGQAIDDGAYAIRAGDDLAVAFDPERKYREEPKERNPRGFRLVYSDEHLAVVEKEAWILTVPTPRGETNTLYDNLSAHLAKGRTQGKKLFVVHRLDRGTSGLLVFARTPDVARRLIAQFAQKKPEREYAALVAGALPRPSGTIESHLATDKALNQKSASNRRMPKGTESSGELAITHYRVVEKLDRATLVAVNLETGKRNQIRVHFSEMGHPVLGDQRYEAERARHPSWRQERLALHARILGFRHPVTGEAMRFEAALPPEFAEFIRVARCK